MARDFNPDLPQKKEEEYLGYSRGAEAPKADTSLGDLLKGVGNLFEMGVTAVDNTFKKVVENEWVEKGEKGVRDVFLGLKELPNNIGLGTEERARVEAIPDELVKRGERLKLLSDAMAAGRIKPSHYETLLDVEARSLKARYPGYRQFIDDTVKKSIGHNPANALVQDLYRESQAAKGENEFDKWFKHGADLGLGEQQLYNPDGSKKSLEEIKRAVVQEQAVRAQQTKDRQAVSDRKGSLEEKKAYAEHKAGNYVQTEVDKVFNSVGSGGQPTNWEQFNTQMTAYIRKAQMSKTGVSEKDIMQIRDMYNTNIVQPTMMAAHKALTERGADGFSWADHLDVDGRKRVLDGVKSQLDFFGERLTNKDYGFLYSNGARLKAIEEGAAITILNSSDFMKAWAGANKALGPQATGILMAAIPNEGLAAQARAIVDASKLFLGNSRPDSGASLDNEFKKLRSQALTDPKIYNVLADEVVKTLADPDAKEGYSQVVNALYGDGNKDLLKSINDPFGFFVKLAGNPAVAENLYNNRNEKPEDWAKYRTWVSNNFASLLKGAGDEANRIAINSANYDLKWNPDLAQFSLQERKNTGTWAYSLSGIVESKLMDPAAKEAVTKINTAIRSVMPLVRKEAESTGIPPEKILQAMVGSLNIDFNAKKQGPQMTILWNAMFDTMMLSGGSSGSTKPDAPAGSTSGGRPMVRTGGKVDHGRLEDSPGGKPQPKGGDRPSAKGGDREDPRLGGLESD